MPGNDDNHLWKRVRSGDRKAFDALQVSLAAGQLLAYLEGETGLAGYSGGGGHTSIQTAPKITIGGPLNTTQKLMDACWAVKVTPGTKRKRRSPLLRRLRRF